MPLDTWYNPETGVYRATLKKMPPPWVRDLQAPNTKLTEKVDRATNKSRTKNQHAMLKKRARDHARNVDLDDTINVARVNGLETNVQRNMLNEKGERRRRIDDL